MAVVGRRDVLDTMRGLHFSLSHFARGTYPVTGTAAMSANRLLFFEECGKKSRISWEKEEGFRPEFGDVCLIPAGVPADVTLDAKTHFVSIQFRLDLFFGEDLIGRTGRIRHFSSPDFVREAVALYGDPGPLFPGIRIQEMLIRIFSAFELDLSSAGKLPEGGPEFRETLRIIGTLCDARTGVSELAGIENMPRGSFSRAFARKFGMPPKTYLEKTLMLRAETLLRQPGMNVRKTAEVLRFSSEFYFSRFFRRHAGISPDEFRRGNF